MVKRKTIIAILTLLALLILGCQNEINAGRMQQTSDGVDENITTPLNQSDQLSNNISFEGVGFISGKVFSYPNVTVKVQAIQNLSWVAETTADANGNYNLTGLKSGKYGLLFVSNKGR